MSNLFNVIKNLVFENKNENTPENQFVEENTTKEFQGVCKRCHKTTNLKKQGLCENCFEVRKLLVFAANPQNYNDKSYYDINKQLDELTRYDYNKLDIENAEIVEHLNGIEKAFLLYCDAKSIDDFKVANYWFYECFIDCNYLISKFIKNEYLKIDYNKDLTNFSSDFLKETLKQANLIISGTKSVLAKRIEENLSEEQIKELSQKQGKKFIITDKGLQEIGNYKPIIAHDVDFENTCYDLILENKLNEAYKMMCQYEKNKLIGRGLNCDWNNPSEKNFRINLEKELPFNLPNCLKPYEKDVKATTIYTNIMGSNPRNAVPFFCQRINSDVNRKILEKAFIFLSAYESGAKGLDCSDIENLEQEQIKIDNAPKEVFENLSIDKFIEELKNKIIQAGLDINKLEYDILKDGTFNFTYHVGDWNSQIGRIVFGKKKSSMQILTQDIVKWLENLPMEEYINNIDKWILFIKETEKRYNELYNNEKDKITNFEDITRIIEARKTGDKKLFFYNSKNEKVTTESFVKEFYELQGYKVMRAEVNFWQAMFCLVFFEEIYSMNTNAICDIPIDLFQSELFYQARKNIIDEKYNYIKSCNLPDFINNQILKHGDSKNRLFYMNLPTYKVDNIAYFKTEIVQEFVKKVNQNLFCEIVYKIARNPNENRSGLPDFIIWNNDVLEFIEVKRIDEKLRTPQGGWIEFLISLNANVYIVRVK